MYGTGAMTHNRYGLLLFSFEFCTLWIRSACQNMFADEFHNFFSRMIRHSIVTVQEPLHLLQRRWKYVCQLHSQFARGFPSLCLLCHSVRSIVSFIYCLDLNDILLYQFLSTCEDAFENIWIFFLVLERDIKFVFLTFFFS